MELSKSQLIYIEEAVKASMRVEGLKPSAAGQEITRKFLLGKIKSSKAVEEIIKLHGGKRNG